MNENLVVSYLSLRKLIGISGFMLPVILGLSGLLFPWINPQPSISEYYFTEMRDVFVGNLFIIGVFLATYRGHGLLDQVLSLISGISAIGISLFPTDVTDISAIGIIHYVFAALFFSSVAYYSLFVFTKGNDKSAGNMQKTKRNLVFIVCGSVIYLCLALIVIGIIARRYFDIDIDGIFLVFILETIAIWAFSVSWLVKGQMFYKDGST